jgi:hypothetical protein
MGKDFGAGVVNDVTGIPKGLYEGAEGLVNVGLGGIERAKSVAFGAPQEPSQQEQTGTQQLQAAGSHLARGGAFAAGIMAASLGSAVLEGIPVIEELGINYAKDPLKRVGIGKIAHRAIEGATGLVLSVVLLLLQKNMQVLVILKELLMLVFREPKKVLSPEP